MKALSAQDLAIAEMLAANKSHTDIAREMGISTKTVQRRQDDPGIVAYIENFRAKMHSKMEAATEKRLQKTADEVVKKIDFTFADAAKRYMQIADNSKNDFCKLKALDSLVNLFGVARQNQPVELGEPAPTEPDVYVAEWARKPQ